MIGVGRAAAGAVQPCPAVAALGLGIDVAAGELVLCLLFRDTVPDIAQLELLLADKLMAGIKIAPGSDSHVFRAGAAAGDAFVDARPAGEVDHVVIEGEGAAFALALEHQLGELFILLQYDRQILLRQRGGIVRRADHRLHAQLREAEVEHLADIGQKIGVGVREGAAHVVVLAAARGDQLLKLGHDALPAAVAGKVHAIAVVHLLAPVETEHHIAHLTVAEVDHVVVDQHAVGREGEAEVLAGLFLAHAGVGHQILDHLEVQQRLAAKEIDLQIAPRAGVFDQEVQRALADIKAHHRTLAVILALACKAVGAV